jgi:hypothetical protein
MSGRRLLKRHFEFEIESWKRMLGFLSDENINSKLHLSDIVKDMGDGDGKVMERVEYFHNTLLKEDEVIDFLYKEVIDHNRLMLHVDSEFHDSGTELKEKQKKMRIELENAKSEFFKLNLELNDWLYQVF